MSQNTSKLLTVAHKFIALGADPEKELAPGVKLEPDFTESVDLLKGYTSDHAPDLIDVNPKNRVIRPEPPRPRVMNDELAQFDAASPKEGEEVGTIRGITPELRTMQERGFAPGKPGSTLRPGQLNSFNVKEGEVGLKLGRANGSEIIVYLPISREVSQKGKKERVSKPYKVFIDGSPVFVDSLQDHVGKTIQIPAEIENLVKGDGFRTARNGKPFEYTLLNATFSTEKKFLSDSEKLEEKAFRNFVGKFEKIRRAVIDSFTDSSKLIHTLRLRNNFADEKRKIPGDKIITRVDANDAEQDVKVSDLKMNDFVIYSDNDFTGDYEGGSLFGKYQVVDVGIDLPDQDESEVTKSVVETMRKMIDDPKMKLVHLIRPEEVSFIPGYPPKTVIKGKRGPTDLIHKLNPVIKYDSFISDAEQKEVLDRKISSELRIKINEYLDKKLKAKPKKQAPGTEIPKQNITFREDKETGRKIPTNMIAPTSQWKKSDQPKPEQKSKPAPASPKPKNKKPTKGKGAGRPSRKRASQLLDTFLKSL